MKRSPQETQTASKNCDLRLVASPAQWRALTEPIFCWRVIPKHHPKRGNKMMLFHLPTCFFDVFIWWFFSTFITNPDHLVLGGFFRKKMVMVMVGFHTFFVDVQTGKEESGEQEKGWLFQFFVRWIVFLEAVFRTQLTTTCKKWQATPSWGNQRTGT